MMQFKAYGDSALLINFEQEIAPDINDQVIRLNQTIQSAALPGVSFLIPAYCSLTVGYDPLFVSYNTLCEQIKELTDHHAKEETTEIKRILHIPVCYEPPYSLDFPELAQQTGCSQNEIIELHTTIPFRVYMLGFLPGFAYMGRLPDVLFCNRKTTPRLRVPAQSVGLAGYQTGIYPSEAPGGWQIIGRTPLKIFSGEKAPPFLFQAGDEVQFRAISTKDFEIIEKDIASGTFNQNEIYAT